jgi:sugar/nucleoside kinase (ribokinase family)
VTGGLCVIGDIAEDVVVHLGAPIEAGTDTPSTITRRRGGSAASVAEISAGLGIATRFVGCIGNDRLGDALASDLAATGVEVMVQRCDAPTGSIVVLVDQTGERTFLSDRGANAHLGPIDVSWMSDCAAVHLTAYSLADERTAHAVLRAAVEVDFVTLDLSSTAVLRHIDLLDMLRRLDPNVVFANESEAAFVNGVGLRLPNLVVHGRPADPLPVDDTTGAGDAFAAGYLSAVLRGAADPTTVAHAVARAFLMARSAAVRSVRRDP